MKDSHQRKTPFLLRSLGLLLLVICSATAHAQELKIGMRMQKTQTMYWENGISAQYAFANFKPKQFVLGFDYVSSRFGTAFQSNAIKQDNFLLSASWMFFKDCQFHIVTRLNAGYFYSDLESDIFKDVPNTAFLFSPEFGVRYDFKQLPISLNLGSGYYIITAEDGCSPGTLQPLYYHLDIHYTLFKNQN
jgi:hypothetical protein